MSLEQRLMESITRATEQASAPTFDLATIRRDARRRAALRATAATAVVAIVAVGLAGLQLSRDDRADPPVNPSTPTSTPTTAPTTTPSTSVSPDADVIPGTRAEQVVVTWDQPPSPPSVSTLLGRRTSDDPDYSGDGEVSVTAPVHGYMQDEDAFGWERYCSGAPGTWWVFTVEPRISFLDVGRCDGSGQPSSAPPPGAPGPMVGNPGDLPGRTTDVQVRMFLTDQDPTAYHDCVAYSPKKGCADVEPPHAIGTGARFGVAIYGREPAAPATTIFGSEVYPAARVLDTTYSFTIAVAAATGSRRLTYRLPPSTHARIVRAMAGQEEPCRHTDAQRSADCLPVPKLRIDGQLVDNQGDFLFTTSAAQAQLAPGGAHEVTLEVPASDADMLGLGFVVFEARGS